ncbi:MAG: alpha-glucosidase/alpha-galactosidase [Clostridia bacterium]
MLKITFMGAGSTVFVKNVIGDCMCTESLRDAEFALYDIDEQRLNESKMLIDSLNKNINENRAVIKAYLGVKNRKSALSDANFVVNAIQVGGYDPCTIIDFEIPKRFGIRQTIADTLGIGGIMRALRTIPVMKDFAEEMEEVCKNAIFLNYTNPMSMLSGYMQRYSNIQTIGLCHSVQVCSSGLLNKLDMSDKLEGRVELIAGINHMAWLLDIKDNAGNDLYPEIRKRANIKNSTQKHNDMVRFEYIKHLGYYCTESSEHNAEYNPWFIKPGYPELIDKFNIPLDEYPRRCIKQIENWAAQKNELINDGKVSHTRSSEYASYIMESVVTNKPYKIGGNVINHGLITNLPDDACVELPCMIDGNGVNPCYVGKLPVQLAAMNMTNINVHLMTIQAAVTKDIKDIYRAVMLEPRCSAILSIDDIVKMVDELINAHQSVGFMTEYK